MFDAKKLTESQISTIKEWAAGGAQLNDIQKQMEDELGLKLTYMDVRFLALDLEVKIRDIEGEAAAKKAEEEALQEMVEPAVEVEAEEDLSLIPTPDVEGAPPAVTADSAVTVTLDAIAKPGLMASGRVTFSNGQAGDWYIDDNGLGINPDSDDCEPGRADVEAFQQELQRLMDSQ